MQKVNLVNCPISTVFTALDKEIGGLCSELHLTSMYFIHQPTVVGNYTYIRVIQPLLYSNSEDGGGLNKPYPY